MPPLQVPITISNHNNVVQLSSLLFPAFTPRLQRSIKRACMPRGTRATPVSVMAPRVDLHPHCLVSKDLFLNCDLIASSGVRVLS